jgi:hypothetical protein
MTDLWWTYEAGLQMAFGYILEGLGKENVGIFKGHLVLKFYGNMAHTHMYYSHLVYRKMLPRQMRKCHLLMNYLEKQVHEMKMYQKRHNAKTWQTHACRQAGALSVCHYVQSHPATASRPTGRSNKINIYVIENTSTTKMMRPTPRNDQQFCKRSCGLPPVNL